MSRFRCSDEEREPIWPGLLQRSTIPPLPWTGRNRPRSERLMWQHAPPPFSHHIVAVVSSQACSRASEATRPASLLRRGHRNSFLFPKPLLFSSICDSSTCLAPLFPVCLFPVTRCALSFVPGLYIYMNNRLIYYPRRGRDRTCTHVPVHVSHWSLGFQARFHSSKETGTASRTPPWQLWALPETHLDGCRATWRIPPPGDPAWTGWSSCSSQSLYIGTHLTAGIREMGKKRE